MTRIDTPLAPLSLPTNDEGQITIEDQGIVYRPDGTGLYFVVTNGLVEVAEPGQEYTPANSEDVEAVFRALSGRIDTSSETLFVRDGRLCLGVRLAEGPVDLSSDLPVVPSATARLKVAGVLDDDRPAESVDGEVLTVEVQKYRKERLLSDLRRAADAEAKMDILAAFLDRYGFDAIFGLIPNVGDGAVTAIAGIITFWQGMKAGIGIKSGAKIAGFHLADFIAGQVPYLGEIADIFIKPNSFAAGEVAHRLRFLLDEARAKGVSAEEIQEALRGGKEFKETWHRRMLTLKKVKKVFHIPDKPSLEDHGTPPANIAASAEPRPPEAKVAAEAGLPQLAGEFLLYQDVLDKLEPAAAERVRREGDRAKWGKMSESEERYALALKELFVQDATRVIQLSNKIREDFSGLMGACGFNKFNPFSLSQSWSLWDMAKQHHYHTREPAQSAGYHLGDPLTDETVQNDILTRHFGWELYQRWRNFEERGKIERILSNMSAEARAEAEDLLEKTPNAKGTLSSKDLARLGRLIQERL